MNDPSPGKLDLNALDSRPTRLDLTIGSLGKVKVQTGRIQRCFCSHAEILSIFIAVSIYIYITMLFEIIYLLLLGELFLPC